MDPTELPTDYRDLLLALSDADAEFVLIGGYALAAHGYVRATDDLDVLVRPTSENAQRVFAALVAFGAPIPEHGVSADLFAQERYGYRMGAKPILIEILTTIDGVSFDDCLNEHRSFELDGRTIKVIGRGALLANKRASARPKDLADIAWLERHPPEGD